MNLESLIINLSNRQKDFFFIQAGACDGFMADPIKNFIRPLHWKGIFLEPDGFYLSLVQEMYTDIKDRFIFENCAISTTTKNRLLYSIKHEYVNPTVISVTLSYAGKLITTDIAFDQQTIEAIGNTHDEIIPWIKAAKIWNSIEHLKGQGSFYKEKVLSSIRVNREKNNRAKHVFQDFDTDPEKYISSSLVKCKTINNLIEENNIEKIDLLVTDLQGYDSKLLLTLDSFFIKPKIIYFESHMINEKDKSRLLETFRKNGYEGNFSDKPDSIFYRPKEVL